MITYGLAEFDRHIGTVDWNINFPMDGVQGSTFYEFLQSAGNNGWELCAAFPSGLKGSKRLLGGETNVRECQDSSEIIALIFKRADVDRSAR
jgi:hypothetical protein